MLKTINNTFYIILLAGILGLIMDPEGINLWFFGLFMGVLKVYLFSLCAFWVLKRALYKYEMEANEVLHLAKRSPQQSKFILQGVIIFLLCLVYQRFYASIWNAESFLFIVLLIYFFMQVLQHNRPTLYLNDHYIAIEDYFIDRWNWIELEKIEFDVDSLKLLSGNKSHFLDLGLLDDLDQKRIAEEVERNVLDGAISHNHSSQHLLQVLHEYAKRKGLVLEQKP